MPLGTQPTIEALLYNVRTPEKSVGLTERSFIQMNMGIRKYYYVGPSQIFEAAKSQPTGYRILTLDDLRAWIANADIDRSRDGRCIATFTISMNGDLMLAPRRSEHVACASGGPVLSAGEISFDDDLAVIEISNQSTGFCPEPESWEIVALALDRIGIRHPGSFTICVVYRLCPKCGERNIVKDDWYYCAFCNSSLPKHWNFFRNEDV